MSRMVDVGDKPDTRRIAIAEGLVRMEPRTLERIREGEMEKGDVLAVAQLAGIMAAKHTSDLLPLCHPLPLTHVAVQLEPADSGLRVEARVETTAKTGVEMEALTAVSVAALTVYDMAKGVDPAMRLEGIRLIYKEGGKSGTWRPE